MPKHNRSPWLHQLDAARLPEILQEDAKADVAIVGAGIAGIATAYFTLAKTGKSVLVVERSRLAHGATGHNAGLVIAAFERPLVDLVREFGDRDTAEAVRWMERGWTLLDEMYNGAGLDIPFSRFTEATGLTTLAQVKLYLDDLTFRDRQRLPVEKLLVAAGKVSATDLAAYDSDLYEFVAPGRVLDLLETDDAAYIAAYPEPGGALNSALFCQEVVRYLARAYPGRFRLVEGTKVEKLVVRDGGVTLDCGVATIDAESAVLCTNGFEDFTIVAENGLCFDKEFHRNVQGVVGYMSAYLVPLSKPPAGLVYLPKDWAPEQDDFYYYSTRRPYEYEPGRGARHNLVSVGGPQVVTEEHTVYSFDHEYPEKVAAEIDAFAQRTWGKDAPAPDDRRFAWHGLMGYTRGMVRMVGPHPAAPRLLYNLGCNGIGILPSIAGGETVARHLSGEKVPRTIFTPSGGTC
jgi:glycine/D-amino acid oxidase-like deaminating enzyme